MTAGDIFIVGLDGVPPSIVEEGIEAGRLPTFKTLRDECASGVTNSTVPPVSMMAWSSFATGCEPGTHGIYNFMLKDDGGYQTHFANADTLRQRVFPLWEFLNMQSIPTGIMNVMPGYPPSRTKGFHISDHITTPTGGRFAYPKSVETTFRSYFSDFELGPPTGRSGMNASEFRDYISHFFQVESDRIKAVKQLISKWRQRVMVFVFSAPDILLHEVGHLRDKQHPSYKEDIADEFGETPLELLEQYDQFLAWVRNQLGRDGVLFVLSDHGHGPVYQEINLNSWLYQHGYLNFIDRPWTRLKLFGYDRVFPHLESLLKRINLYENVKQTIARSSGKENSSDLARLLTISEDDIDWNKTEAFTVAGDGQIYLNTKADHSNGLLSAAEANKLQEQLQNRLAELKSEYSKQPVFESIYRGEEIYNTGNAGSRPDLVCVPEPTYRVTFPQTMQISDVFVTPQKYGSHSSRNEAQGIFFADGGPISPISNVSLNLADYAPTIIHLLDEEVPAIMDGTVQQSLLHTQKQVKRSKLSERAMVRRAVRRSLYTEFGDSTFHDS